MSLPATATVCLLSEVHSIIEYINSVCTLYLHIRGTQYCIIYKLYMHCICIYIVYTSIVMEYNCSVEMLVAVTDAHRH